MSQWLSGFWSTSAFPASPPLEEEPSSNEIDHLIGDCAEPVVAAISHITNEEEKEEETETQTPDISVSAVSLPPPSSTKYEAALLASSPSPRRSSQNSEEKLEEKSSFSSSSTPSDNNTSTSSSSSLPTKEEQQSQTKEEEKKEPTAAPKWFDSASKWRKILVGDRTDVSMSEEELFILLGRFTMLLEDYGEHLTALILNSNHQAKILFEGSEMSEILLLSLQLITDRLNSSVFVQLRARLLQDLSKFLCIILPILSKLNLSNDTPQRDCKLEEKVCAEVRSHPSLLGMWAVHHGTSVSGGNEIVYSLWEEVISILLPMDIVSPDPSNETNKTVHSLAKKLLKKSRTGLSIVLGKCCADLLTAFENGDLIDLVFYQILMALKVALPPMSEIVSKKIAEAVWGKEAKSQLENPSVVSGPDLMTSRELWPKNPSPSPSYWYSLSSSPSPSMKKVSSAPGMLLDSDVFLPFENEDEDPNAQHRQPFLQKQEGDAINSLVVSALYHICGSRSAATFLSTSPFIIPEEIEKEFKRNDVLVHTSNGQQLNLTLFLPLLHMIFLKVEPFLTNPPTTPLLLSSSSPLSSSSSSSSLSSLPSLPSSPLLSSSENQEKPFSSSSPTSSSENQEKPSPSLSSSSPQVEPGPASAASVNLKELWGEKDEDIERKLKSNFVENFFKDPERIDPILSSRLNAWALVGLFQGLQTLRNWFRRFPFLLKTIFLIVLRTILECLFPEIIQNNL